MSWLQGRFSRAAPHRAPNRESYRALEVEVETNLRDHVLEVSLPRAANFRRGGFDQNFSHNWTRKNGETRSIVYQSRLTWLASRAALHFPAERERWLGFARGGFEFLQSSLWDARDGGFFWQLDDRGAPVYDGEKHLYGNAFAIYALSDYHAASGDEGALQLAQRTFTWLDELAHDARNGGYFEALSRAGCPLSESPNAARPNDLLGTRFGRKSMNAHLHLMESLTALKTVWPDAHLESRLREIFLLARDVIAEPSGTMAAYFSSDWKAVAGPRSFGHDIEAAFLLLEASRALDIPDDEKTWQVARALTDHTLDFGFDARWGGCYNMGETGGKIYDAEKIWWVQAEALNTLLMMHQKFGAQTPRYWSAFTSLWDFIGAHQTDSSHGGWHARLKRNGKFVRGADKSNAWTDGYHQGRALMEVAARLRALVHNG